MVKECRNNKGYVIRCTKEEHYEGDLLYSIEVFSTNREKVKIPFPELIEEFHSSNKEEANSKFIEFAKKYSDGKSEFYYEQNDF